MYIPHLLKEVKPFGTPGTPEYRAAGHVPAARSVETKSEGSSDSGRHSSRCGRRHVERVNGGGTGARIRMAGFDIAGKTGTAQVVGLGKDVGKNKDHSWFVTYAPAYKPEIAMVALIENSGFGGHHAAPAVRGVYDVYYRKTRHEEPPGAVPNRSRRNQPTDNETGVSRQTAMKAVGRSYQIANRQLAISNTQMVAIIHKRSWRDFDWILALLAIGIVVFGTIQIRNAQPTETYWVKQLIGLSIGLVAMLAIAFTDYRRLLESRTGFLHLWSDPADHRSDSRHRFESQRAAGVDQSARHWSVSTFGVCESHDGDDARALLRQEPRASSHVEGDDRRRVDPRFAHWL